MGNLDKIINLKCNNQSNMTIITALLIFYLVVANNFIGDLYSGQLKNFIIENRLMKHIIGLITMLLIIVQIGGVHNWLKAIIYSFIAYLWFILTTKLDLHWNLAILGLLVLGFMYEKQMFTKELESNSDEALEEIDKKKIRNRNKRMKRLIVISIISITIIGSILYYNRKMNQYGGSFDDTKFFLG